MQVVHITPVLNVTDLGQSFDWFSKLGWIRKWAYGDPPTFGAVGSGAVEIFLCQDGQGGRDPAAAGHRDDGGGVWMSWWVKTAAEVDAAADLARREGLIVTHPPTDEPWCVRECHIRHPDGHTFRVSGPPAGRDPSHP